MKSLTLRLDLEYQDINEETSLFPIPVLVLDYTVNGEAVNQKGGWGKYEAD